MNNMKILEIFIQVLAIGRSKHFSVSVDYDNEFDYVDMYLWYSTSESDFELADKISNRSHTYDEILNRLQEWQTAVREERKKDETNGL